MYRDKVVARRIICAGGPSTDASRRRSSGGGWKYFYHIRILRDSSRLSHDIIPSLEDRQTSMNAVYHRCLKGHKIAHNTPSKTVNDADGWQSLTTVTIVPDIPVECTSKSLCQVRRSSDRAVQVTMYSSSYTPGKIPR